MGKSGSAEVKETAAEKADAEISVSQWNDYVTDVAPKVQRWAADVNKDKSADREIARGITNADIAQATKGIDKQFTGMNPNSGQAAMMLNEVSDEIGAAGSGAAVEATQGVDNSQIAQKMQVANIGMGQKTEAVEGIGDIARQSTQRAITTASNKLSERMNNVNTGFAAAGTLAGMD